MSMAAPDPLMDFASFPFTHAATTRTVYRKGSGPAVMVMHEVPGITPEAARFARYVGEAGFTVFMPHLFGTPGKSDYRLAAGVRATGASVRWACA